MNYHEEEGFSWLSFELLDEAGLINAVTLKPLNMGFMKADDQAEVLKNFETVKNRFGLTKLSWSDQRHEDNIVLAGDQILEADGLFSQEKGRGLLMTHADCQIGCFFDPVTKAVAAVHAGWRGNVKRLYIQMVSKMKKEFGSRPENILAAISPSLGPRKAQFLHWKNEFPEHLHPYRQEEALFDLWSLAEEELLEAGLLPTHIQIAKLCTYELDEQFYSYRRGVHQGATKGVVPACNATLVALPV